MISKTILTHSFINLKWKKKIYIYIYILKFNLFVNTPTLIFFFLLYLNIIFLLFFKISLQPMPPFSIFGLINCLALPQTLLIQTTQSIYTSSQATWLENHHYVHVAKADEMEGYVVDYGNRRSLTKTIKLPQCVVIVVNLCARADCRWSV